MKASHVGNDTPVAKATVMLTGSADAVGMETAAAGYHYAYDKAADQFAHPAVAYVVTAQGRISRVLSGMGLNAADLRLALVDAGQGRVGTIADRIRLLCYCFDPATGIYSVAISQIMLAAGILTLIIMAGGISFLALNVKRRASS
jgi:protein SCO1/2